MSSKLAASTLTALALATGIGLGPCAVVGQVIELPDIGCPMAHCDGRMSDLVGLSPPMVEIAEIWHRVEGDGEHAGSLGALGCAGNGSIVACSYNSGAQAVAAYDYEGNRLWDSGPLLSRYAVLSAPIVARDGSVIACDHRRIVRFDPAGQVVWNTLLPFRAVPVSPVLTPSGVLVVVTFAGPIFAFDSADGSVLDVLILRRENSPLGFFHTRNTPGVRGERVYVVMEHTTDPTLGRLVAVEVMQDGTGRRELSPVWSFEIGGPSRASPLVIGDSVYFDSARLAPATPLDPQVFAVRDEGESPELLFQFGVPKVVLASMAQDPRGGFWLFSNGLPELWRYDELTGNLIQSIDIASLLPVGGDYAPNSGLTVAGTPSEPIMLLTASSFSDLPDFPNFLVAIDLASETLVWAHDMGDERPVAQFPIVLGSDGPRVVFSSFSSGARAVGELR